MERQTDAI